MSRNEGAVGDPPGGNTAVIERTPRTREDRTVKHAADVSRALHARLPLFVARKITAVIGSDGSVTLNGDVSSFYHKQVAQESVRQLGWLLVIDNQLEVLQTDVKTKAA